MKRKDKKNRERKTLLCKIWSVLLATALVLSFLPSVISAEASLPFTDVSPSAWYFKDVKNAYEKGLINGKSPTRYAPDDQMTYAEAVKLAACMHQQKKEGSITLKNGNPWYMPYVEYAYANGLISDLMQWNQAATRAGYMSIFANVLPDSDASKNAIADGSIPDVPTNHPNAAAIYKLYRAGIVTGVDAQHNCKPLANIKRSEVAAILTRMTDASARVAFNMGGGAPTPTSSFAIIEQPRDVSGKLGDPATLKVRTTGGKGTLIYQWQWAFEDSDDFKNSTYPGNDTDTLQGNVEDIAYRYQCVITDEDGQKLTSNAALVKKDASALAITKVEADIGKNLGDPVTIKVLTSGGKGTLKYQWRCKTKGNPLDYKNYEGAGATTDTMTAKVEDYSMVYCCVVTDEAGQTAVSEKVVVEASKPLTITKEEENIGKNVGDPSTLKVTASGGKGTLKYQWQWALEGSSDFTNSTYPGNDTNTLQAKVEDIAYQYRCVVTDEAGKEVISKIFLVKATP